MKIFELGKSIKYAAYATDELLSHNQADSPWLCSEKDWEPQILRQYLGEGPRFRKAQPVGDCARAVCLLFRDSTLLALKDLIHSGNARFFEAKLLDDPDARWYYVFPKKVYGTQIFDPDTTTFATNTVLLGGKIHQKPYAPKVWKLKEGVQFESDFFGVFYESSLFVTEHFLDRVVEEGLVGFQFDQVYLDKNPLLSDKLIKQRKIQKNPLR